MQGYPARNDRFLYMRQSNGSVRSGFVQPHCMCNIRTPGVFIWRLHNRPYGYFARLGRYRDERLDQG